MAESGTVFDVPQARQQVQAAVQAGRLSAAAADNIEKWLTEPRYSRYAPEVARHVTEGLWQELDDVFFTVIPFGTGGRRGRMYPIGSNAINDRTIGESAQGLADYVKATQDSKSLSCAIAYDTRHKSRHFAELCAGIMAASGFHVYFLDGYHSTPALSFAVRHKQCSCGIMVTASHNPPSDNAVKVYWSTGGQVLPPHDKAIIQGVMNVEEIQEMPFADAVAQAMVTECSEEIDREFTRQVLAQGFSGPRELKVIFSPLHGVAEPAVCPVLAGAGFQDVEVFAPHREPSGDFPNVPGHVANPENPAVFDAMIERAGETNADLILATDPDCDRMGCAAPSGLAADSQWATFTGNQLAALLTDYVLERRSQAGSLSPEHYVVKTLVTTEMVRRIADSYQVQTRGNLLVGFKWIAQEMDRSGPDRFVFGCEESHGYLAGQHVRDKDAAVACLLLAELAAQVKQQGQSLHEKLDALYWQHGYHAESLQNVMMPGSEGMARMKALMARYRSQPPQALGGMEVTRLRDYLNGTVTEGGRQQPLDGPQGDMVILDFAEPGNYVAVRPSGTEPKAKFYIFTYVAAEQLADLATTKRQVADRIRQIEADVQSFAERV